jgi:Protein of unknown function (DUF3383)
MSDIDEILSVTLQVENSGVAREPFGLAMIVSHNAAYSERIRYYGSDSDVAVDFADPTGPEALAAATLFSQNPHPARVAIGRATLAVTMKYALSPQQVAANHVYAISVAGQGVTPTDISYKTGTSKSLALGGLITHMNTVVESTDTYPTPTLQFVHGAVAEAGTITDVAGVVTVTFDTTVSLPSDIEALLATATSIRIRSANSLSNTALTTAADEFTATPLAVATATNDEITSNLVVLLNAVVGKNFTATQQGSSGSHTIQVLGNATGNWFSIAVADPLSLKNALTHTGDPTADLTAIELASAADDWYTIITLYNSQTYVLATAAYAEANGKTYFPAVPETEVLNATTTGNADTLDKLNGHGYTRTLGQYHPVPAEFEDAALVGRVLSLNPGLWTAAYKSLVGPVPVLISGTQKTNLKAKRANYYTIRKGRSMTLYGTVGSTVYGFIDTVVGLDFFVDDIQSSALGVFVGEDKVGYDDADIAQITTAIYGAISRAYGDDHKIISKGTPGSLTDPIPSFTFPKVADIDPSQRALRNIPDGVLVCRLLGAAQSAAMRLVVTF